MNKIIKSLCLIIILTIINLGNVTAQRNTDPKPGEYVRIKMHNGKMYKGTIESISTKQIMLDVEGTGTITVDRSLAAEVLVYDLNSALKIYDYENHLYSKYYIGESAIGLNKGEAYYQNIMIFLNFFSYGVSDNFSIGGGFETISLFNGRVPVFFVNPKLTFHSPSEKVHFGVGTFAGLSIQDPTGFGGAAYTNVTFGDKNNNITAGVGIPYASEVGFADLPVFQIAGMGRLSNRLGIVGELFIADFDDDFINDGTFSFGTVNIRIITENAVFDVGALIARSGGDGGAVPVASAALKFLK